MNTRIVTFFFAWRKKGPLRVNHPNNFGGKIPILLMGSVGSILFITDDLLPNHPDKFKYDLTIKKYYYCLGGILIQEHDSEYIKETDSTIVFLKS